MLAVDALAHLRERLSQVEKRDASRHLPHWTLKDIEAVAALVERPAAAEQIYLGRIEGLSYSNGVIFSADQRLRRVHMLSRRALGLDRK